MSWEPDETGLADDYYDDDADGCMRCFDEPVSGLVVVCVDDVCRATGGCGGFDDPSCYRACPDCKGQSLW